MLRIILFLIFIFTLYSENIGVIIYADENYPPYSYVEAGELKGIYTDIIEEASKRVEGYDIELKSIPWKRGLSLIEDGGAFALYPPYFRPTERPWMDYSIPILEETIVILANKYRIRDEKYWLEQLKTMKIGQNRGFEMLSALSELLDINSLDIEEAPGTKENLLKLGRGRIDIYVNDRISMLWTLKKLREIGDYKENYVELEVWKIISKEFGHIGYTQKNISTFNYKKDFKNKMDKALKEMKVEGKIEEIVFKYIGMDF